MELLDFTAGESVVYLGIFLMVAGILTVNYLKGYREFWSPMSIVAVIYGYYCLLGPYEAITSGNTYDRLVNMRPFYFSSFLGALVALLSFALGFTLKRSTGVTRRLPDIPDDFLLYYGKRLFIVGFVLFTVSTGGNVLKMINPLDAEYFARPEGGIMNYFALCINFLIGAVALLFLYFLRTRKGLWLFVITFLVAIGLFTTLGFRYRMVLMISSMAIIYYFNSGKKPSLVLLTFGIFLFIGLMGIINLTRRYGTGLDMARLKSSEQDYYASGLKEANIFQTTGAMIDLVPERYPHAGFDPIWSTLIFPIPRALYAEKDSFEYLKSALDAIYGDVHSKGAAVLAYGEYYLAFGWWGIVIGNFLLGWFYKKLWLWYLSNWNVPIATVVYAVCTVYLYVILSRGYLPQVTNLFFFTVVPGFVILKLSRKKYLQAFNRRPVIVR